MNKSTMTIVAALAAGAAAAVTPTPYFNNFATRASGATPSSRWMETSYIPGALVRSVSSISTEGREPYNSATAYQDGWTMKAGACRTTVLFNVVGDSGNQGVLVTNTTAVPGVTVAMQPFNNEFTNGVLKISADIRTPGSSAFDATQAAYATIIPLYKSALNVADSALTAPTRFGMANADYNGNYYVRANVLSKNNDETGVSTYGRDNAQNNLTAGNWYRYEAVIDIAAGTFTVKFGDLGSSHPSPDSVPSSFTTIGRYVDNTFSTTFKLTAAPSASSGGFAGIALYVLGFKKADASAAPMFDNLAVSWKAPGATDFASVYENNFTTRRYRQIEPAGATSGTYALVPTTNTVQSSFYERGFFANDTADEGSCRRLVPDASPYIGQDGWCRLMGTAYFTIINPNNSGYGWNNASVLRCTGADRFGLIAAPIGKTVTSGKVRLYFDIMSGVVGNSASSAREIIASAILAGDAAYANGFYSFSGLANGLSNKGVAGGGICTYVAAGGSNNTAKIRYSDGSKFYESNTPKIDKHVWGRYVVTVDLDARKYDFKVYSLGSTGQPMNYNISSLTPLCSLDDMSFSSSAPSNIDTIALFTNGNEAYGKYDEVNGKKYGRYPLFDNIRVCQVNADGTDGAEIYRCDFEYSWRTSAKNAASLPGHTNREGTDRWIRRGNNVGTFCAIDAGEGDNAIAINDLGWIEYNSRMGYAVQPFGAVAKNTTTLDVAADIRPPERFTQSGGFAYVEVGGDNYYQGVYRPASGNNWRYEPRIGFGFTPTSAKDAVGHYPNVVLSVQTRTTSATTTTNSAAVIDKSHWYRFRVKAAPANAGGMFTVKVYDQGTTKPAAGSADGTLVATFADLALPAFGGEGMTTLGLAASCFTGTRGGGIDDPNVVLIDNLSAICNPAAFVMVFK